MLDLIIKGGLAVTPSGPAVLDIGVRDGQIVSLSTDLGAEPAAARTIAADGLLVVPGGIDPHIHCDMEVADPAGGPSTYTHGPEVVSRAALHGGTTTLIDFAWNDPKETLAATLERQVARWKGASYADFSFHVALKGELAPSLLQEIPQIIDSGFISYKIFTSDVTPGEAPIKVPFGSIWELFKVTSEHHGVVAVHAEDDDLVMHMYRKLFREGRTGFEHMAEVHSSLSEDLSFRRVIGLAESVPGTVIYMMHVSAASGVRAIADGRGRNVAVYGETLHQYALHTQDDYREPDGMKYHTYPSLKTSDDTRALWQGVARGDIAAFATDELCTSYAVKTAGRRIDDVTGGNTGVEPRMSIVYTEVVESRKLGLNRFVEVTSTNAAKIMGLYPRKGVIAVGSDADLALLDPSARTTIRAEILHESDYTPWEGWSVSAWPVATILRGEVVVERGRFVASGPGGELVHRTLLPNVRTGVL
jgi:dihydropyrimidinase